MKSSGKFPVHIKTRQFSSAYIKLHIVSASLFACFLPKKNLTNFIRGRRKIEAINRKVGPAKKYCKYHMTII